MQIWVCPSSQNNTVPDATANPTVRAYSYTLNALGSNGVWQTYEAAPWGVHLADVADPAGNLWIFDGTENQCYGRTNDSSMSGCTMYKRHSDGANFGFFDGHVKWLRDTSGGMWTRASGD
ncbi:MAG: hypothetical protein AUJ92_05610 [Armatimonadetes bacterium CG2_30_59_28]|nr:hypothetical protein [Armatimonadota bacterium]OIO96612.1 MAG: hypothetical protein AUJ92_05610 [Armatimonadetes bacterium CG2_30_59_28]PIU66311.1 MAG: hypothetical protein COS85_05240 [Armatimonadetes bacterium CG07_land_8_20_14_0_80_59_28]PIY37348.1 MAG: hypothetical protein COZ05_22545 [Armatimonadetes bacterium CG_4_10_14_3_um_filter_59_10]PJB61878.1 MAG: hypothetical protein CO095_19795 [Armatimonadetes bacterium CG_4_9_14_3_um_filter_58_7]